MFKVVAQFVLSGSIVVLASYLSPRVGQKWAGLLVAAPFLTLLTFIFLSLDSSKVELSEYLLSALFYMIPAAVFILSLFIFSQRLDFVANILVSAVFFGVVAVVIHQITKSI